jgi:hypothetical protein
MLLLSISLTIVKAPVLWIQYIRAKHIANKMFQEDETISLLNA